jgi:hypothetical protein
MERESRSERGAFRQDELARHGRLHRFGRIAYRDWRPAFVGSRKTCKFFFFVCIKRSRL